MLGGKIAAKHAKSFANGASEGLGASEPMAREVFMNEYDLLIIGAGPAGLTAGIYGQRAGLKTCILEKNYMGGGQILNTDEVDNYPGLPGINGFEMGKQFEEHAKKLGVEFKNAQVTKITDSDKEDLHGEDLYGEDLHGEDLDQAGSHKTDSEKEDSGKKELQIANREMPEGSFFKEKIVETDQGNFHAKTIILAMGTSYAQLEIPGEKEFTGRGVSYCAVCDGAFFRGKTVCVIGGGNTALGDVLYLAGICKKVYCIHRGESFRGAASSQQKMAELANVEVKLHCVAEAIEGTEQVESIKLRDLQTGQESILSVDGVFIAVGSRPNTKWLDGLVACDEKGYILAGEDCRTSAEGIFAAGDIRQKPLRQIITAAADGANAANAAKQFISNYDW